MGVAIQKDLTRVREWAQEKAQGGGEPPWAWYQYMKLVEAANSILAGMDATTTESSPQLAERRGNILQLGVSTRSQDSAQPHSAEEAVPLPM